MELGWATVGGAVAAGERVGDVLDGAAGESAIASGEGGGGERRNGDGEEEEDVGVMHGEACERNGTCNLVIACEEHC